MTENVAIFGGSFDPPTLGHLMVVSHLLLNDASVDTVFIVPCYEQKGKNLTSFEHRVHMCRQQFGFLARTHVSEIERDLGGESLTVRLVQELSHRHRTAKFRFVMGADLLGSAPDWEGWDEIQRLAPPLIIGRAGISPVAGGPTPIAPLVSSSIVRKALAQGDYREAGRYLSVPVCEYIQERGLYSV